MTSSVTNTTSSSTQSDPKKAMQKAGKEAWKKAGEGATLVKKGTQWTLWTFMMSHVAWRSQIFWMSPVYVKLAILIGSTTLCTWTGALTFGFISGKPLPGPRNFLEATNPATILFNQGSDKRGWFDKKTGEIDKKAVEWNKNVIGDEK